MGLDKPVNLPEIKHKTLNPRVGKDRMYKNIIVCIDQNDGRKSTIRAAAQFASASDANLIGL